MYIGKITNCYTQALLSSFIERHYLQSLYNFEIATTIPFGVIYRSGDPNRLLDSFMDPDIGLDRGMNILKIPFDIKYWPEDSDGKEALHTLNEWCATTPVVLGPLNMERLTYYFQGVLYKNMDHYVVVTGKEGGFYSVCDPECMAHVLIQEEDLRLAWKADGIQEGRGAFTMRRVKAVLEEIKIHEEIVSLIFKYSVENMKKAADLKNGGSNGLRLIAQGSQSIENSPSLIRGFSYAIPTRIQRCMLSKLLLQKVLKQNTSQKIRSDLKEAISALDSQVYLYGSVLNKLLIKAKDALKLFNDIALYENNITYLLSNI